MFIEETHIPLYKDIDLFDKIYDLGPLSKENSIVFRLQEYLDNVDLFVNKQESFSEELEPAPTVQSRQVYPSAFSKLSEGGLNATTLYAPGGRVIKVSEELLASASFAEENNILIIGNGGAGLVGLVKHLADEYNAEVPSEDQLILGWKLGDSHMNFESIERGSESGQACDLYITYEPMMEQGLRERGLLNRIIRLFNDEFPIIGPSTNPAHLSSYASPVDNMSKIMAYALGLDDRDKKVYFSRWNNSAMGVKDQELWCRAADSLSEKIVNTERVDAIIPNIDQEQKGIIQGVIQDSSITIEQKKRMVSDILLSEFTDHHVFKPPGRVFPSEAVDATMEKLLYGITDAAQIILNGVQDYQTASSPELEAKVFKVEAHVFNHADKSSVYNVLTNPAQLLVPATFDDFPSKSPQAKFLNWLQSDRGHDTISSFTLDSPQHERKSPYEGDVRQSSLDLAFDANRLTEVYMSRVGVGR